MIEHLHSDYNEFPVCKEFHGRSQHFVMTSTLSGEFLGKITETLSITQQTTFLFYKLQKRKRSEG